jgi:small conductance mechanosensitive channel
VDRVLEYINLEQLATRAAEFVPRLGAAVVVLIVFWLIYRVSAAGLQKLMAAAGMQAAIIDLLIRNVYRLLFIAFAVVMAAGQLGINVGAAIAGLGVAGIAIGFAAQDTLANTIAGIVILWDQPFVVGDSVTVADQYGQVTNITLRTTRIRTPRNTYVVIPNRRIVDEVLVNHSKHGQTRVDVPVGIAYKEDIREARRVILESLAGWEAIEVGPAADVVVAGLGDSSVDLMVRVWIDHALAEPATHAEVVERVKYALDGAGIQIPFPHLQLFVDDIEERVWRRLGAIGGKDAS